MKTRKILYKAKKGTVDAWLAEGGIHVEFIYFLTNKKETANAFLKKIDFVEFFLNDLEPAEGSALAETIIGMINSAKLKKINFFNPTYTEYEGDTSPILGSIDLFSNTMQVGLGYTAASGDDPAEYSLVVAGTVSTD